MKPDPIFVILPVPGPGAPDPWKNPGIVPPWLQKPVPPEHVPGSGPRFRDCGFGRRVQVGVELLAGRLDNAAFQVNVDSTISVQAAARTSEPLAARAGRVDGERYAGTVLHDA